MQIATVSYLNTRPFIDGLEARMPEAAASLSLLPPAACAASLREGKSQLALLPVGALPELGQVELLPQHCIGADGPVDSVFLFSRRPISEIRFLAPDAHSRSSNLLAALLLRHHWRREVELRPFLRDPIAEIRGEVAGVVIGDRAIRMRGLFPYAYDLAGAWRELTGLPFVFAVWASRPGSFSPAWQASFESALAWGVARAAGSADRWASAYQISPAFARTYLTRRISYAFDAPKHRALALFLSLLAQEEQAEAPKTVAFLRNP
jgi:chorismate dehydratase